MAAEGAVPGLVRRPPKRARQVGLLAICGAALVAVLGPRAFIWANPKRYNIRNWKPADVIRVREMVERVQRGREPTFNIEGPEGEDCGNSLGGADSIEGIYDGEVGTMLVALDRTLVPMACAATVTGDAAVEYARSANVDESDDLPYAVLRRIVVDNMKVAAATTGRANLIRSLIKAAEVAAYKRGAKKVVALGYDDAKDCQPSILMFQSLGYTRLGTVADAPGAMWLQRVLPTAPLPVHWKAKQWML
jgi:hypothetical protein